MTARAKDPTPATISPSPLVLFGIDSRGKPKGARFGKQHAGLAVRAAGQLQLNVLATNDPSVADLAARLPVGRVHATGRTVRAVHSSRPLRQACRSAAHGTSQPTNLANGASGASGSPAGGPPPHLPRNWQEIGVGDLVIANQSDEDGWYEAVVVEANGDMLTMRWRDYPRERRIVRHRLRLGLLYPKADTPAEKGKPAKAAGQAKNDKNHLPRGQGLPKHWDAIDINHLVLAKDDGKWGTWWEAIPIEKAGDSFKLRWRDNPTNAPSIIRPRLDLALICPDA
jgi:hypothetical protein